MLISDAYAQDATNTTAAATTTAPAGDIAQPGAGNMISAFGPLVVIFVIFYMLLIRPQQRRAKEHMKTLDNLAKGDRIVTGGGIIGTVNRIEGVEILVEIADGVKVRVQKNTIAGVLTPPSAVAANDITKK